MNQDQELKQRIYLELEHKLHETPWQSGASEAHGVLTALACTGTTPENVRNRGDLFQLSEPDHIDIIEGLFAMAYRELENDSPGFNLLLPTGDESQLTRAEAISSWCQGFITGLCRDDTALLNSDITEVREALADIMQIGHIELDPAAVEDNERALIEIEEFLRIAIQLVYDHLQPAPSAAPQSVN